MATKVKVKRVKGDTYILCTFGFCGPMVLASGNTVARVMGEIEDHLDDEESLSFCRVGFWTVEVNGDPSDCTPHDLTTIFQITPFEIDALEDEEEEN